MLPKRLGRYTFVAAVILLVIQAVVPVMWLSGAWTFSPRWAGRLAIVDLILLLWVVYAWCATRLWRWGGLAVWTASVFVAGVALASGHRSVAIAVFGALCMSLCFAMGHWLIRVLMSPGLAVCGVARTLIDEAVRMKVVLVFIIALLLWVPFLPFLLDPKELLKYRVQFFLTWTLSGCSVLLGLMTVFLACGTICYEVGQQKIFLTLTKPVGRGQYLLGKWLGIALLNLLLVVEVGIGVYVFSWMLRQQTAVDQADRQAVEQQIFVARQAAVAQPPPEMDLTGLVAKRLEELQAEYSGDDPQSVSSIKRRAVQQVVVANWYTIPPRGARRYVFTDLASAREMGRSVQLRMKPVSSVTPPDERVRLAIWLNGRPYPTDADGRRHLPIVLADGVYHVVGIPATQIDGDGRLEVRIANVNLEHMRATFPSSVAFAPRTGLEVLYPVGWFGPNLFRALGLIWVRLLFLAMLGLMAGSFLDFPVACLLSLLVYVVAMAHGFLVESIHNYVSFPTHNLSWWHGLLWVGQRFLRLVGSGELWEAAKILIKLVGSCFVSVIPSFSGDNPVALVADGRVVSHDTVGRAVKTGLTWTGYCAIIAWAAFRRRELARVTV